MFRCILTASMGVSSNYIIELSLTCGEQVDQSFPSTLLDFGNLGTEMHRDCIILGLRCSMSEQRKEMSNRREDRHADRRDAEWEAAITLVSCERLLLNQTAFLNSWRCSVVLKRDLHNVIIINTRMQNKWFTGPVQKHQFSRINFHISHFVLIKIRVLYVTF